MSYFVIFERWQVLHEVLISELLLGLIRELRYPISSAIILCIERGYALEILWVEEVSSGEGDMIARTSKDIESNIVFGSRTVCLAELPLEISKLALY